MPIGSNRHQKKKNSKGYKKIKKNIENNDREHGNKESDSDYAVSKVKTSTNIVGSNFEKWK